MPYVFSKDTGTMCISVLFLLFVVLLFVFATETQGCTMLLPVQSACSALALRGIASLSISKPNAMLFRGASLDQRKLNIQTMDKLVL